MADDSPRIRRTTSNKETAKIPKVALQDVHGSETGRHRRRRKKVRRVDEEEGTAHGRTHRSQDDVKDCTTSVRYVRRTSISSPRRRNSAPSPALDGGDNRKYSQMNIRSSRYLSRPQQDERRKSQPILGEAQRPRIMRSKSMREDTSQHPWKSPAKRGQAVRRSTEPLLDRPLSTRSTHAKPGRIISIRRKSDRPISILSSIFGLPKVSEQSLSEQMDEFSTKPRKPRPNREVRVECLTCMSDVAVSKAAKLKCGHQMCNSCLRRIFNLSVSDPQHMPPKCCTQDHIPLKHVDKLFDIRFKKKWNKKYQEYTTKNRIYCPRKGCGEWIKPSQIFLEAAGGPNGGRKYGMCSRCKIKVCCACNCRWHPSIECPRDEATQNFTAMAKEKGWQRCFNCQATVELKEGCNHMTCRCRAEFCMICGSKWKTCDCPWFNYGVVEQDRLNHMNVPEARQVPINPALGYQEEMDRRREQERRDEAIARRMHVLGLDEPIFGLPAGHRPNWWEAVNVLAQGFMPANNAHAANTPGAPPPPPPAMPLPPQVPVMTYQQPPSPSPPPPLPTAAAAATAPLRQHSTASRLHNNRPTTRPSERVIPRRTTIDYEAEAALHQPRPASQAHGPAMFAGARRHSAMAGLTRGGSGAGRVEQWRRHVIDV